ncbi:MAG TPA: hypothetical protein VN753_18885 [Terracidiphilus sp.]|jgi:hypothetical protein|nr:hypothetical protein [Terracidiphilus sp.]
MGKTNEACLAIEFAIQLMRYEFLSGIAPSHNLFRNMRKTGIRPLWMGLLRIKDLTDPTAHVLNFLCAEDPWIVQVLEQKLAHNDVVVIEIGVAVSIGFFAQSANGANHFPLHSLGLSIGRNEFIPKTLELGLPWVWSHCSKLSGGRA